MCKLKGIQRFFPHLNVNSVSVFTYFNIHISNRVYSTRTGFCSMRTHKQNSQLIYNCVEGTRMVELNLSDFWECFIKNCLQNCFR